MQRGPLPIWPELQQTLHSVRVQLFKDLLCWCGAGLISAGICRWRPERVLCLTDVTTFPQRFLLLQLVAKQLLWAHRPEK